jgi:hypothetical protein
MEEVLSGDCWCSKQYQTHQGHGKQATNRVSTIKLPDGQYTQTGRNNLKELFRVYFPDSSINDDSGDAHEQPNQDAHR